MSVDAATQRYLPETSSNTNMIIVIAVIKFLDLILRASMEELIVRNITFKGDQRGSSRQIFVYTQNEFVNSITTSFVSRSVGKQVCFN